MNCYSYRIEGSLWEKLHQTTLDQQLSLFSSHQLTSSMNCLHANHIYMHICIYRAICLYSQLAISVHLIKSRPCPVFIPFLYSQLELVCQLLRWFVKHIWMRKARIASWVTLPSKPLIFHNDIHGKYHACAPSHVHNGRHALLSSCLPGTRQVMHSALWESLWMRPYIHAQSRVTRPLFLLLIRTGRKSLFFPSKYKNRSDYARL